MFGLRPEHLRQVFPFHLIVGADLRLLQVGPLLQTLVPSLTLGEPFAAHFAIVRPPVALTFEALRALQNAAVVLRSVGGTVRLRGQVLDLPEESALAFLVFPAVTSLEELGGLGLRLEDFPAHSQTADHLVLLQSAATTLKDARALADTLRSEREKLLQANRLLSAQYAVTDILSTARDVEEATADLLRVVCQALDWDVGALWTVPEPGVLACRDVWTADPAAFHDFVTSTTGLRLPSGTGLPGRVLNSGEPAWIVDVASDPNFPRALFAERSRLVSGLAFPIRVGGAVTTVVEFFSRQQRPRDSAALQMLAEFGNKLGQFVERLADQAARERAEARYRHLVTTSPTITYSCRVDPQFAVTFVSENVETLFGWRPAQFIADPGLFLSKVHEDDRAVLQAAFARMLDTGFAEYDYRFQHRNGDYVWRHDALRGVADGSGRIVEAVGASQDVTALKRVEADLRASEERKSAILDTALDCVVTMDHHGAIVEFNSVAERTFGYRRDEVLGREMAEVIVPPPFRDAHRRGLARVVAGHASALLGRRLELTGMRADGSELPVELAITRVERDGPPLFVGYLRDITERKRAEEELRAAKAAAEAANESKSAFLAAMSHEIRTPLNAIVGMTELALGTSLTTEQREYLASVQSATDALLGLINDVLDVSKIEAGQVDIDETVFDLRELTEDVVELFAARAHAKRLELVLDVDPDLPSQLVGDPGRIRQILGNLVGNGLKFTDRGSLHVSLRGDSAAPDDQVLVRLTVADTGIGIPADRLPYIFDRFYQGDGSITRRFGGSGLGLTISRSLAVLMGGTITCESTEGAGSTFVLRLPLRRAPSAAGHEATPVLVQGAGALVVLDPGGSRDVLAAALARLGFSVTPADSEASALAALSRGAGAFPLALVGTTLAGAAAADVARALRAAAAPRSIALVALHPLSLGEQQVLMRDGTFDAVLTTPFRWARLAASVRAALGLPRPETHAIAPTPDEGSAVAPAGYRVLVAEDNEDNQVLARRALEHAGCRVEVVADGHLAVERARDQAFDLVLMDLQMPGTDGFTATRQIRNDEARLGRPPVPIVALTAHALGGFREQCLSAGMNDYLAKPFKAARLQDVLAKWIDHRPVVLVADDTPEGRTIISRHLELTGQYRVLLASDGNEALQLFDRHRVSLVLLDMQMPVMDGYATAAAIRRRPDGADVPILAVTGETGDAQRAQWRQAGCSGQIAKPVFKDELLAALRSALERRGERRAPERGADGPRASSAGRPSSHVRPPRPGRRTKVRVHEDLLDLVPEYLDRRRREVAQLRELARQKRFSEIRSLGHQLKGSGGGYGFDELTRIGRDLEDAAGREAGPDLEVLLDELDDYLALIDVVSADDGAP